MTTIKDMIQHMDRIEGNTKSTSIITEASLSINANAETAAEIGELMRVMQLGGMVHNDGTTSELPHMEPDGDEMPTPCGGEPEVLALPAPEHDDREMMKRRMMSLDSIESGDVEEDYANEPEEEYHSTDDLLASGDDLHKTKKSYAPTNGADNPMAEEIKSIAEQLLAALAEKKGDKPDFADIDGDGDKEEPMAKAAKDKEEGSKPEKGEVPPQFKKK